MDDADFLARLKDVMDRHRDPELHTAIWDYREGKISRRELMTHPAFSGAMRADAAELQARLEAEGMTPARLRARLEDALVAAGEYPPAPGEPDVLAPVPPER
jgi:hypothetical protein